MGADLTPVLVAKAADFCDVSLIVVTGHAGTDWIALRSIKEAMPFIGSRVWDGVIRDLRWEDLTVRYEGRTETLRFLDRRVFFGLAIQHKRFDAFKQAVLDLVEAKQDGEVFQVDPRLKADPLLKNIINTFELAQQVALANLAASEAKQIAAEADRKATLAIEGTHTRGERMTFLGWCRWHHLKVNLTRKQAEVEGRWLSRYSREFLDDEPKDHQVRDECFGYINTYLPEAFDAWMQECLPHRKPGTGA